MNLEEHEQFLRGKYKKLSLNASEVAEELSITKRMVTDRIASCSAEIPRFKRIGRKAIFPIREVAKFLIEDLLKVT